MQKHHKPATAKVFRNGRSQAVRLPLEYRVQGSVVSIRRDEETGDIILSPQQKRSWAQFFKRLKQFHASGEVPADFLTDHDKAPAGERNLF